MITSTSSSGTAGVGRARAQLPGAVRHPLGTQSNGYARETELSKLIRYGCQFELEMHQMVELNQMRAENIKLRRTFGVAAQPAGQPGDP